MKKDERGSLVVEATLTFTVFILVMASLISLLNIAWTYMRIQSALTSTASELSAYTYIYSKTSLQKVHDDAASEWESQKEDVNKLFDEVSKLGEDAGNIAKGDIDWDSLEGAADNAEALVSHVDAMVENPQAAFKSFMAFGKYFLLDEGKSLLLGELSRGFMKKYLAFDATAVGGIDISADDYLKSMGVTKGVSGLNFEKSKLFADGEHKVIDIVVEYEYTVPFSPFALKATMINRATTVALLDGDGTTYED